MASKAMKKWWLTCSGAVVLACGAVDGEPCGGDGPQSVDETQGTTADLGETTNASGPCVYHEDCALGFACVEAECIPFECYYANDCEEGETCFEAQCVPRQCRDGVGCEPDQGCTETGVCIRPAKIPDCASPPTLTHEILADGLSDIVGVLPFPAVSPSDAVAVLATNASIMTLSAESGAGPILPLSEALTAEWAGVADLDLDGTDEVVVLTQDWLLAVEVDEPLEMRVVARGGASCDQTLRDYDGDGVTDLLRAGGSGKWFRGDAEGGFEYGGGFGMSVTWSQCKLAVGTIDLDPGLEVLVATPEELSTKHDDVNMAETYEYEGMLPEVALADLDDDGAEDPALLIQSPEVGMLLLPLLERGHFETPAGLRYLRPADVDQDGLTDLVAFGNRIAAVFFANGDDNHFRCVASFATQLHVAGVGEAQPGLGVTSFLGSTATQIFRAEFRP